MGTRDESHEKEKRSGVSLKCIGLESMVSEIESLSPEDEFYVWAQHPHGESQKIGVKARYWTKSAQLPATATAIAAVVDFHRRDPRIRVRGRLRERGERHFLFLER